MASSDRSGKTQASSPTSTPTSTPSAEPTKLPEDEGFDLEKYKKNEDAKKLVAWVKEEHGKAEQARSSKKLDWFENMSMFYGNQYAQRQVSAGQPGRLFTPQAPKTRPRKTVNHTRAFVRSEHSKFLASIPDAVAVPGSSDDEDLRAAQAAEQVWESVSEARHLRAAYKRASWWAIVAGVGFIKTWWDNSVLVDPKTNTRGDIRYGAVTPFHILVPDLREPDIEDQPFVINAYTKTVEWCKHFYGDQLKGVDIQASTSSPNTLLEEGFLNLAGSGKQADSITVYEAWVKPGATKYMPQGGVVIIAGETIVNMTQEGLPYTHGMYPFAKFDHIDTETFYADSPLRDTNQLQREYNEYRTDIGIAAKLTGRPQYIAQKGSVVLSKWTNQAGAIIEYKPGTPPPTAMAQPPLQQYVVDQQDRILSDWENITGQHEVSRGNAPAGVTSGTAINYLQEKDDAFLAPQHESIEQGYEKIAVQTVSLFNQFVDVPRRIKIIGTDGAFDSVVLAGADIVGGTDIRIQRGSSIGQSKAARDAKVMDMWASGIITDPNLALKLMEQGGADKVLDIMNVAEKKAMRENLKMKMLNPEDIAAATEQARAQYDEMVAQIPQEPQLNELTGQMELPQVPEFQTPLLIPVDDFDVHDIHVETHNKFRMGQEYEMLPPEVREQFELHDAAHQEAIMTKQLREQFAMGQDSGPGMPEEPGAEEPPPSMGGATMAPNGAVPDAAPAPEGM